MTNSWHKNALQKIFAEMNRSSDTHLLKIFFSKKSNISLYLKDESSHITGSLKHRLARSLYLYGICNGWINENTTIIEASSGNTAVAEAYFAFLLGLRFIAVMPKSISQQKIKRIEHYQGECVLIEHTQTDREVAYELASKCNSHFMDQFTFAERAVDWRSNNNIAESTFRQMANEQFPIPEWIVCGAGTGGTAATFGRYIRYALYPTQLCVVDPEDSVLYDYFIHRDSSISIQKASRIEGIGRRYVPASFFPDIISRMIKVPDDGSIAALYFLEQLTGLKFGASTGSALYGSLQLAAELQEQGKKGSIVVIAGDSGHLYHDTYYNHDWLKTKNIHIKPYLEQLWHFYNTGKWVMP
ncbi:PLP-dependent cysteine synthase family protein [Legionella micdadei]|uniref:Cysteine synthase n=1 Tax=Legionella micdadei TaxID=451 RepID=A0A098GGQ3_LEGMI|nr:pyridoxal-phosphate dependent enzyme [Legionella micdadei]ARG97742.1 cysteine synthase [Legionella micdadei]KTD28444.1 cystathionine beta-synthase [Legionella micdadei]NSL18784.1 pyridoxal-phosphate dependent enzyme [Legionella micdadei]CEG60666.1 Cysteine synthase [Legionella micdadei]SCX84994.1 cysteine synthase A [Legionella micdadei]